MSFLQRLFRNTIHDGAVAPVVNRSSFELLNEDELEAHLGVTSYGHFHLTDAIRPSYDLQVTPKQGYRHDTYRDETNKSDIPVLMATATKYSLFELFIDLIAQLGSEVDVVLETSHNKETSGHLDLFREHIDMPILQSILWDYEDLLMNDGCTGIAVMNPNIPQEVQFDEHKMLIVYGSPLERFEAVLETNDVFCDDEMKFITEAEHVHSSSDVYFRQFDELKTHLGMDSSVALQ